ncbi:hypothetical protein ACO2Q0_08045 [Phenylobacterium sp. VNQ135]|uniref:hypothetical protein n=1 Tax=Phenylobacterium sp. VNQ135 TaxID=3400922 RepID=UPI003C0702C5
MLLIALLAAAAAPNAEQVLAAATPEARAAFDVDAAGLTHRQSGFRCPSATAGVRLTEVTLGDIPDQGATGAACAYADENGPETTLYIFQGATSAAPLDADRCRRVPETFGASLRKGLPGTNKMVGPEQVQSLGALKLRGADAIPVTCAWVKAPFSMMDVAIRVTAARAPDGWTLMAASKPYPTKAPSIPISTYLRSLMVVAAAAEPAKAD